MTFKEAWYDATDWQRKVALVSIFHNARLSKDKHWKLINTAKYFGISLGLVSESLKLARRRDEVSDCKSRNEALKRIK